MQLGMIGLGRMGANMVRRLMKAGHECVVHDVSAAAVQGLAKEGAAGAIVAGRLRGAAEEAPRGLADGARRRGGPDPGRAGRRSSSRATSSSTAGNSYYHDDIRRAGGAQAEEPPLRRRGNQRRRVGPRARLLPHDRRRDRDRPPPRSHLRHPGPGHGQHRAHPGREKVGGTAEQGYLHCGPNGAGHFVKMVHNGIEYGIMAAYAEGLNILHHANVGKQQRAVDAETTPLRNPEHYQYDLNLPDVTEVWRRGSVIASWLLDLTAIGAPGQPGPREVRRPRLGLRRGPVDGHGGHRRIGARAGAQRGPLRALQLARRGGFRQQAPVGHALRVRRPPGEAGRAAKGA